MKRLSILAALVLCAAAVLAMSGVAQANFAIHGGYLADTDACAGCHRAHTASSGVTWTDRDGGTGHSGLLVGPPNCRLYLFCYVCHGSGAPGAATDVQSGIFDSVSPGGPTESDSAINAPLNGGGFENFQGKSVTSFHLYNGGADSHNHDAGWPAWGESDEGPGNEVLMDCGSCHDPHGSSNYRILKDRTNGHNVGGYIDPLGLGFAGAVDPDPYPFVISVEQGFPLIGDSDPLGVITTGMPTNGFRLHRQYPGYRPNYTTARYARGEDPTTGGTDANRGMSGWCIACHENYMTPESIGKNIDGPDGSNVLTDVMDPTPRETDLNGALVSGATTITVDSTTGFDAAGYIQIEDEVIRYTGKGATTFTGATRGYFNTAAVAHPDNAHVLAGYDAEGTGWSVNRHRHPMNVPLSVFRGDRDLIYNPNDWQAWLPSITFVDIPLDNDPSTERGPLSAQSYQLQDWIECLTCHRAHGTAAAMTGYAMASMQIGTGAGGDYLRPDPTNQTGVPPSQDSALLRADNRGVCERCHNK